MVESTGEPFGLRDRGLLESALAKPRQHWNYDGEDDALCLAVTLLFGIARNHPFQQGNKRTAFEAALIFLEIHGYQLAVKDTPVLAEMIVRVIGRRMSEQAFEDAIRPFVEPLPEQSDDAP